MNCFSKTMYYSALFVALWLAGCSKSAVDMSHRPCDEGRCLEGHTCHPENNTCVPILLLSCDIDHANAICPAEITTGQPCASHGSFVPCGAAGPIDCSLGCRTCGDDGRWSECSEPPECLLGRTTSCSTCADDCTKLHHVSTASCVPDGETFGCVILSCVAGFVDQDNILANGCEYICVPTEPSTEVCDGQDNNCDGFKDPPNSIGCDTYYRDADGDGFGRDGDTQCLCAPQVPYTATQGGDCDDDPAACGAACNPDMPEVCGTGYDNNCSGIAENDEVNAEGCTLYYKDADGDGYGDSAVLPQCLCAPSGEFTVLVGGDCNDDPTAEGLLFYPGAPEPCDADADYNCSGSIGDEGATGCDTYYRDEDADEFGVSGDTKCLCAPEAPYTATVGGDCDDDPEACGKYCHPDAAEICDGYDNNCSGHTDEGCTLSVVAGPSITPVNVRSLDVDDDGVVWVGTRSDESTGKGFRLQTGAAAFEEISGLRGLAVNVVKVDGPNVWFGYNEPDCDISDLDCECGPSSVLRADHTAEPDRFCTDYLNGQDNGVIAVGRRYPAATAFGTPAAFTTTSLPGCTYVPAIGAEAVYALERSLTAAELGFYVGTNQSLYRCELGPAPCARTCQAMSVWAAANDSIRAMALMAPIGGSGAESLLVGSQNNGLALVVLNADNDALVAASSSHWNMASGMPGNNVRSIAIDEKNARVFVATGNGVGVLDLGSGQWHTVNVSHGLPHNNVSSIAFDAHPDRRIVWVGTVAGVAKIFQGN